MRETTEARELTNEQRIAKIIDDIIKMKNGWNKPIFKLYSNGHSETTKFSIKNIEIYYAEKWRHLPNWGNIEEWAEIKISFMYEKWSLFAEENGDSHEIVWLKIIWKTDKSMEQILDMIEQRIAEDYLEQWASTKQELAATLGSES